MEKQQCALGIEKGFLILDNYVKLTLHTNVIARGIVRVCKKNIHK